MRMKSALPGSIFVFLIFLTYTHAYNYLVVLPVFGYSHMKFLSKIADTLADAGHSVTVLQVYNYEHFGEIRMVKNKNVKIVDYHDENSKEAAKSASAFKFMWDSTMMDNPITAAIVPSTVLFNEFEPMCKKILSDKKIHKWIVSQNFDAYIAETFDFCALYLGDHLKQNLIPVFSAVKCTSASYTIGEPSLVNYSPTPHSKFGPQSTAFDRVRDILSLSSFTFSFSRLFENQHKLASGILDGDVRNWKDILQTATFYLTNSNPYISFQFPTLTKTVEIGGFAMDPPKNLDVPQEYETIFSLRNSTVLLSFGTVVRSADMPDSFKNGIIEMFHKLPHTSFIWKYEQEDEELKKRLPSNVFLKKWVPQPALLADPRLKVFITHGGLGSSLEVAYSGKPALMIPIFGDQNMNSDMLQRHGGAKVYQKMDLPDSEKLAGALREIINDDNYQKNAKFLSDILQNQPIDPKFNLIRHCEFAAKFKRVPALEPYNTKYNFIEYYALDAIFIIISGFAIFLYCSYRILRAIITRCCSRNKTKND